MVDKDAKMYVWLPQLDLLVVEAYMGHGISSRYMDGASDNADTRNDDGDPSSGSRTFVKLGEEATFEDAAVLCSGQDTAKIVKIVEEWNGVQPMQYPPFRLSRRINGLLSWWATSSLVR